MFVVVVVVLIGAIVLDVVVVVVCIIVVAVVVCIVIIDFCIVVVVVKVKPRSNRFLGTGHRYLLETDFRPICTRLDEDPQFRKSFLLISVMSSGSLTETFYQVLGP